MELGTSMGTGAVACPVCTLYLREGISLQKHLDTHPKEQVIEALIKASSSPAPPQLNLSQPAQSPIQTPTNPVTSQSPYPVGPVFECPPVASMMSPQFASFSYQQFVNNGTMMVPQYAMAPQANQMMHMLYNPYGMYQQQQIPAVQMIAPISNVPTAQRTRAMVSVGSENGARNNVGSSLSGVDIEPKQILPEIEADVETEQLLPEVEINAVVRSSNQHENNHEDRSQAEHQRQQMQQESINQDNAGGRMEYRNIGQNLSINEEDGAGIDDDKTESESVLPDLEQPESTSRTQLVPIQHEQTQTQQGDEYVGHGFVDGNVGKERDSQSGDCDEVEVEREDNKLDCNNENLENQACSRSENVALERQKNSEEQPEVEQLERLLITIMETEFNVNRSKNKDKKYEQEEREQNRCDMETSTGDRETSVIQETSTTSSDSQRNSLKGFEIGEVRESFDTNKDNDEEEDGKFCEFEKGESFEQETDAQFVYSYKNSISAPASPATQENLNRQRTYSVRSEMGSNENLSSYPVGFEATTLLDEEEEDGNEKRETVDNFDEEDMEIEEITSPHTPFTKHNENSECVRSHTPLSTISGISGLRVRTDLSKPCSPASTHSFHHMDTNSLCADDDGEEIADPETEKDPIDCSQLQREADLIESLKNISHKLQPNHVYHQSVITENLASFSIGHHSQKPMAIHESYQTTNDNLLDLSEPSEPTTSTDSKTFQSVKSILQKPTTELLNINEDAHPGPMNVLEFDGLQILVPSTFISESSQKAVSATSRQSMASSEGGAEADEEIKSVNMRADEIMPPRGELSEQESNGCHEPSAWQVSRDIGDGRCISCYYLQGGNKKAVLDTTGFIELFTQGRYFHYFVTREGGIILNKIEKSEDKNPWVSH